MTDSLRDLPLHELLGRLASRAPTPGGGSASALAGALGAALVGMVAELTDGRPEAPDQATLDDLRSNATAARHALLALVDEDAAAYDAVVAARRLPKEPEEAAERRRTAIAEATRGATRVPLRIAERAADVLELAERLAPAGARSAVSDVGVGALLAAAAMRGAALNVRINLPSLPADDPLRAEAEGTLERVLAGLDDREAAVARAVAERL